MKNLVIILLGLCTFSSVFGYNIKVKIHGMSDTSIILGHYYAGSMYPDDTIQINSNGEGSIKKNRNLHQGLYFLLLSFTKQIDIILGEDQEFYLEADTTLHPEAIKIKGSKENQVFIDFQLFMANLKSQADELSKKIENTKNEKEKKKLRNELQNLADSRYDFIANTEKEYPNLFVTKFLRATLDIKVPDPPKDDKGNIIDSTWQYRYYVNHYFDNMDISDSRFLYTPLYDKNIKKYIEKIIPQIPDSIIVYIDKLIDASLHDSLLTRYMLITLFNHYAQSEIMGFDAVYVHIGEKYYINTSWWTPEEKMKKIKERISATKPILIGKTAPNVELIWVPSDHFKMAKNDTAIKNYVHVGRKYQLHQVDAKYTVLAFWSADCSHCKKSIPALHKLYNEKLKNKGVKIIAISTLFGYEGKVKWIDFVNKYKLYDWINSWNPYSAEFKKVYDIQTTPQLFLLDKNKEIVAKRIGENQIVEIIDALDKRKN